MQEHSPAAAGWTWRPTQGRALEALGRHAGIPIVTAQVAELMAAAERVGAAALPAGEGGGDVALWVSPSEWGGPPARAGVSPLWLELGAPGVRAVLDD